MGIDVSPQVLCLQVIGLLSGSWTVNGARPLMKTFVRVAPLKNEAPSCSTPAGPGGASGRSTSRRRRVGVCELSGELLELGRSRVALVTTFERVQPAFAQRLVELDEQGGEVE